MALFGALFLIFVTIIRPQEFIPQLQAVSLPNLATAVAVLGIGFEIATGKQKLESTPQVPFVLAFFAWSAVATSLKLGVRGGVEGTWVTVGISGILMVVVALATRSYARYRALAVLVVLLAVMVSVVGAHQAAQTAQCIGRDRATTTDQSEGEPDGRACESSYLCEKEGAKAGLDYDCEKVGLFGTTTQGRRSRWRGTLGDPNEFALFIGTALPFLFALGAIANKKILFPIIVGVLGICLYAVVVSGSRGGQLVVLTVFGVYFVRRYGLKGLVVAAVMALPIFMFGGREGEEADSSSLERTELLYEGIDMLKAYPIVGVGIGQFVENTPNHLTAHNSYLLAASELGVVGSLIWSMLFYVSVKIPFVIATRLPAGVDPRLAKFATALCVSYAGMLVGVFFLSFCYKQLLFMFFGLSGSLYGTVRRANPTFNVGLGKKELVYVALVDLVLIVFIFGYSRYKMATGT